MYTMLRIAISVHIQTVVAHTLGYIVSGNMKGKYMVLLTRLSVQKNVVAHLEVSVEGNCFDLM